MMSRRTLRAMSCRSSARKRKGLIRGRTPVASGWTAADDGATEASGTTSAPFLVENELWTGRLWYRVDTRAHAEYRGRLHHARTPAAGHRRRARNDDAARVGLGFLRGRLQLRQRPFGLVGLPGIR